jgi:hypothetical protein
MIKSISCRFIGSVYPGETLVVSLWVNGPSVTYLAKTKERGDDVIIGNVELFKAPTAKL